MQVSLVNEHTGYTASAHTVQSDGYNLKIHRLQSTAKNKKLVNEKKPVVYIQHGLFMSSDCFVLQGPDKDLGIILIDIDLLCHLHVCINIHITILHIVSV